MEPNLDPVEIFIERWRGVTGSERANYQLFVTGLCDHKDLEVGLAVPMSDEYMKHIFPDADWRHA